MSTDELVGRVVLVTGGASGIGRATALVFGDSVQLGGFFGIVVLILAMMAARQAMGLIYHRVLGPA